MKVLFSKESTMEFIHPALNVEIDAIGGHYLITREERSTLFDDEILSFVGDAVTGKAFCGARGCGYAIIAGCIIEYRSRLAEGGRHISIVEPVHDNRHVDVTRKIQKKEGVTQVHFLCTNGDRKVVF
jgi:hypothetical protein